MKTLLALLDSDPAGGILAAADLREQRANAATPGPWTYDGNPSGAVWPVPYPATLAYVQPRRDLPVVYAIENGDAIPTATQVANAHHIAAEHPGVALAAVRRWRGVVERHRLVSTPTSASTLNIHLADTGNVTCLVDYSPYPCPDLTETADEARAYLGGASGGSR